MAHLVPRAATVAFGVAAAPLRPRLLASVARGRPAGHTRSLSSLRTSLFGTPLTAVTLAGRRRVSAPLVQGAGRGRGAGVPGGGQTSRGASRARPLATVAADGTSPGGEMEDSDDDMHQARSAGGAGIYLNAGPLRSGVGGRGRRGMSTAMSAATTAAAPPVEEGGAYAGQIFCNRNLNMAKISAVGFDMDYTLSQYNSEVFEMLSFQGALNNLVTRLGYPEALLERKDSYDHHYFIRGLVVDKVRGNIIKMDRHKYVKVALHGFRPLSKAERETVYDPTESAWNSFAEPNYAVLDTIFSIPDAYLFALLIDYKDAHPGEIAQSNIQIYTDVRRSVDLCHRDGWIKEQVAADPARFIHVDPNLVPMLQRLRRSGRKMFLLTNSLWDYTEVVMTFLYNESEAGRDGGDWKDLFDVIICGSCKPGFLIDKRLSLYRVDVASGQLENTEGILYETAEEYLAGGKVFQGGNWTHLHQLLNVKTGSQLLYVGDHMYSDILRSKRQLGWRTMLVIPELAHEINVLASTTTQLARIDSLRHQQDELDDSFECLRGELDRQDNLKTLAATDSSVGNGDLGAGDAGAPAWNRSDAVKELERLRSELTTVKAAIAKETEAYHEAFHPVWGQLFKTGLQNSTFAKQVESYACLYTASASNLLQPNRYWRCWPDHLPHDWKFGRQETPADRRSPKAGDEVGAASGVYS